MKLLTSTLILLSTFFISCGDNTTIAIITDIQSLEIEGEKNIEILSTEISKVEATVHYINGTSSDATVDVQWRSDIDVLLYSDGEIWAGVNNGVSILSAKHEDFNDSIEVNVIALTSFEISSDKITTTGEHILQASGSFENNETDITLQKNIIWSADNDAVITTEDNIVTIDIQSGDTNVTATVFGILETNSTLAPKSIVYSVE